MSSQDIVLSEELVDLTARHAIEFSDVNEHSDDGQDYGETLTTWIKNSLRQGLSLKEVIEQYADQCSTANNFPEARSAAYRRDLRRWLGKLQGASHTTIVCEIPQAPESHDSTCVVSASHRASSIAEPVGETVPIALQTHNSTPTARTPPSPLLSSTNDRSSWRRIHLLAFEAVGGFARHWALWYPRKDEFLLLGKHPAGTKIHVTGSVAAGFVHEFQRQTSGPASERHPRSFLLGYIHDQCVVDGSPLDDNNDDEDIAETGKGINPRNRFEEIALEIAAPSKGLKSSSGNVHLQQFEHNKGFTESSLLETEVTRRS